MPTSKPYQASFLEDLVSYITAHVKKDTNYALEVSTTEGRTISSGEIVDCQRIYRFLAKEETTQHTGKVLRATYVVTDIRYDSSSDFYREVPTDDRNALLSLLDQIQEYSSPREFTSMHQTGEFYVVKDITIPRRTDDPTLDRSMMKQWLREFYDANGKIKIPANFSEMKQEELNEVYRQLEKKYGFTLDNVVHKSIKG